MEQTSIHVTILVLCIHVEQDKPPLSESENYDYRELQMLHSLGQPQLISRAW